ncbi:MAG: EF-hand domain-containing protein [Aliarcobacter sp.]|nr:EF-hand domain-containing protein [Aliarcobacter sp.]
MKNIVKIFKLSLVVVGSLSALTSAVVAQELPNRGPIDFSSYDTNKDGFVSEKEFKEIREKRIEQKESAGMPMRNAGNVGEFAMFDTNKDGKLTEIELLKGQNKQMQNNQGNRGMGQGMNAQGMGKGYNMPNFENFDLNKDGIISAKEMDEAREKRMDDRESEGRMMKNIGNQPTFSEIDTNKDGNISKEEFSAHQTKQRQ